MENKTKVLKRTVKADYSTPDLALAAYLQSIGMTLKDVTRKSSTQVVFIFEDQPGCKRAALKWHNEDDDLVQASTFSRALSRLKGLAHRGAV